MSKNRKEKQVLGLRFPEFHGGDWDTQELSKVAELIEERTEDKEYTTLSVTSGVGLVSQKEKFGREISGNSYKNYYIIRKWDFAYNKSATKLYPEGYISMLEDREEGAVPNSIFTCFRVNRNKIFPPFLNYLFHDNFHGRWLRNFIEVGARAHGSLSIDNGILLKLPIVYPSIKEQQKIADCLTSLDELITAENQKLEALQLHKKGLMQQIFPAEGEKVPKLRFKEFKGSGEWVEKPLNQVCEINPTSEQLPEKFAYIDLESVVGGMLMQKKMISLDGAPSRAQRLLKSGDVIFQMVRPYQKNNYFFQPKDDLNYVASTGYAQLRAYQSTMYLFQYLHNQRFVERVLKKSTGSSYPAINSTDLSGIMIEIPGLEEQQRIAECLSSIDQIVTMQNHKVDSLKAHKKGLMQQLFPNNHEIEA